MQQQAIEVGMRSPCLTQHLPTFQSTDAWLFVNSIRGDGEIQY